VIIAYIDAHRDRFGIEPIARVLCEHGADHPRAHRARDTVRETKQVTTAIAGIDDTAWVDIAYPDGGTAQVAETHHGRPPPDRAPQQLVGA